MGQTMRVPPFELEVFFGRYEFSTPYLLAQSDCEAMSIDALLRLEPDAAKAQQDFLKTTAGPIFGVLWRVFTPAWPKKTCCCLRARKRVFLPA